MNHRTLISAMAMCAAAALAGCATGNDCSRALETARAAAAGQQPLGAWIQDVDAACAAEAEAAWTSVLIEQCAGVYGFHAAYSGAERPAQCGDAAFESAWNLGEMLSEMEREVVEIEQQLKDPSLPSDERRDLERRLVVIGRDLPQIQALARMDGYLPPAEVPGSD